MNSTSQSRAMLITAMVCSAAVSAEFVGGKATRDALFLTSLHINALPTMLMAAGLSSLLLVAAQARWGGTIAPAVLVPASFIASGALFLLELGLVVAAPAATAVIVYLHVSGAGPLLASGFWLIVGERLDPHTAKRRFGQVAGAGTLGGLGGALLSQYVAPRFGVPSMLLVLAALQFMAAWLVRRLAAGETPAAVPGGSKSFPAASPLGADLRLVARAPHLRSLIALVLLGTISAALIEYLFKAKAVETFGSGDSLLRFFALYYAITGAATFVFQFLGSRLALEQFGLALTTSTPSIAVLAGSLGSLLAPGIGSLMVARGAESVFRGSWFRAGYELFYTPMAADEKRAAKPLIDVAVDRVGDAVGGGLIRFAVELIPYAQSPVILCLAMLGSIGALIAASQLNRWHLRTLESSLVRQAGPVGPLGTNTGVPVTRLGGTNTNAIQTQAASRTVGVPAVDLVVQDIVALRSGDRARVLTVLSKQVPMPAALVAHVIPLLGSDSVGNHAVLALRRVADERVGELSDALLDPHQTYAVRRRVARVLSASGSQRAAAALLVALEDPRFEVRFYSARSLAVILEKHSELQIDRGRVEEVVLKEMAVGRPIWESRRLLDEFVNDSPLDEFVRDRAGQSLTHVFTLLSLILPAEPLRIAFQSLHADNTQLRGTALEYLEAVIPPPIRRQLWPFLVEVPSVPPSVPQPHEAILAELLRSNASVTLAGLARAAGKRRVAGFGSA